MDKAIKNGGVAEAQPPVLKQPAINSKQPGSGVLSPNQSIKRKKKKKKATSTTSSLAQQPMAATVTMKSAVSSPNLIKRNITK